MQKLSTAICTSILFIICAVNLRAQTDWRQVSNHPVEVLLVIYDILGKQVRTLFYGMEEAGVKSITWDGTDDLRRPVNTGVYLYKISAGDFRQFKKMLLVK